MRVSARVWEEGGGGGAAVRVRACLCVIGDVCLCLNVYARAHHSDMQTSKERSKENRRETGGRGGVCVTAGVCAQ